MAQTRSVWRNLWKHFSESLVPKKRSGVLVGKDHFGNKYFEIPSDRRHGKPRASRWFEPSESEKFDQELPSEWEGRRALVPLEEEVLRNIALAQSKKEKGQIIEDKAALQRGANVGEFQPPNTTEKPRFPERSEYEIMPGEGQDRVPRPQ